MAGTVGRIARERRVSLCETLDRVLNKGAVVAGDIVISVADVDLLYLGVNLVVTSVESMRAWDLARAHAPVAAGAGPGGGVLADGAGAGWGAP